MTTQRLPVHPLRAEDVDLVDRWIRARAGIEPEPITIAELYKSDNAPPQRFWTEITCYNRRKWIMAFARRCRVPLREVGLLPNGAFTTESVRTEIQTYAADYAARNATRIEARAKLIAADEQKDPGLLSWRTPGWMAFVDVGTEFYNWLERQGLRPRGSNPFLEIVRLRPVILKREIVVVDTWYKKLFAYPKTLKQKAVILLLANGLRCREVAHAQAADFTFSQDSPSTIRIVGKGNKVRIVYLYTETALAVRYWLQAQFTASRWLFPGRKPGRPSGVTSIEYIVHTLCLRVFPSPEEARIRRRISPHKFRHYFASDALYRGMKPPVVQAQLGHTNLHMTNVYAHLDPAWIRQEVHAIDQGDMLNVPRTANGAPRMLRRRSSNDDNTGQHDIPLW
jgi:integrase